MIAMSVSSRERRIPADPGVQDRLVRSYRPRTDRGQHRSTPGRRLPPPATREVGVGRKAGYAAYGVSRQTIMQRVKRGELKAVHVRTGRRKGLRIQPPPTQQGLF